MADIDYDKLSKAIAKAIKGGGGGFDTGGSFGEGAGEAADESSRLRDNLREVLEIQKDIAHNSDEYFEYLKRIKKINKEIGRLSKQQEKSSDRIKEAELELHFATGERAEELKRIIEEEKIILDLITKQKKKQEENLQIVTRAVKESRSFKIAIKSTVKDVRAISDGFKKVYNFLALDEVFAMSKSIRTSAMQMGVLSNQADSFSKGIQAAALDTIEYGVGIDKIAEMQSTYSDALGRTVILSKEGAKGLAEMSVAAGLGADGAAQMAAELESVGYSAERTAKFTEQAMNDANSMGLNSSKIVKLISQNIKLLNRYNFKGGAKSLAKMAESTSKMGVDMNMVGSMAEKLFDIEGAVEMSAQLQVLGGSWAELGDPFKLMYMARNDMEGLTDAVINATKATAKFNAKTGEFDISALEMQRLRKVAEATGLNYEELAQSAKNAAKFSAIKKQISYGFDDKTSKFIESTATLDEKGKAKIMVGTTEKYLSALTQQDKTELARIAADKADMEQRAKQAVGLDELLKNTTTMLKQLLIPLVDALNKSLKPALDGLITKLKNPKFIEGFQKFAEGVGNFIAGIGKFIIEWPKLTAGLLIGIAGVKWFMHGVTLGLGFNSVARAGGMPGMGGRGGKGGGGGGYLSRVGSRITPTSVGVGLAGMGVNMLTDATTKPGSGMNIAGKTVGSAMEWGSLGFMVGGHWGAAIGGILGGLYGGISAAMSDGEDEISEADKAKQMNDGVIFNKQDKFMKVNDSTMIAGTNVNGNKDLAKAIMSSTAPGFKDTDYLMNSNKKSNTVSNAKVGFDELKLNGAIELKLNNEVGTRDIGKNLMSDPLFIRELSLKVNQAASRAMNGKTD